MKAKLFAAIVLSFVVSLPIQATTESLSKINLNKANVGALSHSVKGIGPKRAEAIVQYREKHGNFKSIQELSEVKGLGKQFVKNRLPQLKAVFVVN